MAIRADWHEGVAAEEGSVTDPFALASSMAMTHAPLSLDFSADELRVRLTQLFKREQLLDGMGLRCPIKDRCDTTCLACPLSEAADPDSPKGSLCRVGIEQDQAETLLAVKLDPDHAPALPETSQPALKW